MKLCDELAMGTNPFTRFFDFLHLTGMDLGRAVLYIVNFTPFSFSLRSSSV